MIFLLHRDYDNLQIIFETRRNDSPITTDVDNCLSDANKLYNRFPMKRGRNRFIVYLHSAPATVNLSRSPFRLSSRDRKHLSVDSNKLCSFRSEADKDVAFDHFADHRTNKACESCQRLRQRLAANYRSHEDLYEIMMDRLLFLSSEAPKLWKSQSFSLHCRRYPAAEATNNSSRHQKSCNLLFFPFFLPFELVLLREPKFRSESVHCFREVS